MNDPIISTSKFLSLILRHQPQKIGLTLDENGWADIDELLNRAAQTGRRISRELLQQVVTENDKQRFAISEDGLRIRASQGHSIEVDLALDPVSPPEVLYHGTAQKNLDSIRRSGLNSGRRQHVHLSVNRETAIKVGQRHGKPIVLTVRSGDMHRAGHQFFVSANGVWLVDAVPPEFLIFADR